MKLRTVSVCGDTVVKVQQPKASRRERLRTLAGRDAGRQTGLFLVPDIVSFDDSRGEIVFERLRVTELRDALTDRSRSLELIGRAAEVLAAIHRHMESSDRTPAIYPDGMDVSPTRDLVPLHGDFGLRNIFYLPGSDRIAVIDWSNADWIGVDADLGAPELDIAVFVMSLFHRRAFSSWSVPHRHEIARHFLATYASASPHGLSIDTLRTIVAAATPRLNRQVRRAKGTLRALGYRHSMIDLRFFLRRLSGSSLAVGQSATPVEPSWGRAR